jgi:hypothetical protein
MVVTLNHVAPRKLALAGRPAGLALSAFWYLGKNGVTPELIAKVTNSLAPAEQEALSAARALMPAWMADAFYWFEQSKNHG